MILHTFTLFNSREVRSVPFAHAEVEHHVVQVVVGGHPVVREVAGRRLRGGRGGREVVGGQGDGGEPAAPLHGEVPHS